MANYPEGTRSNDPRGTDPRVTDPRYGREGLHARDTDNQVPMYHAEHFAAWAMAVVAIALGTIGLLRGFGIIGTTEEFIQTSTADGGITAAVQFWDAMLWLLPAIGAAFLAYALHRSEHHLARNPDTLADPHEGMWKAEHFGAWVVAAVTIGLGALALLVGFDVFNQGWTQADGILWGIACVGTGILTATLHGVRHHQMATNEDYIMSVVEKRARGTSTTTTVREPGTERNR
jgi:hypothetical protein